MRLLTIRRAPLLALLLMIAAARAGAPVWPRLPRLTPDVKVLLMKSVPGIISGGVTQINLAVATALATSFAAALAAVASVELTAVAAAVALSPTCFSTLWPALSTALAAVMPAAVTVALTAAAAAVAMRNHSVVTSPHSKMQWHQHLIFR